MKTTYHVEFTYYQYGHGDTKSRVRASSVEDARRIRDEINQLAERDDEMNINHSEWKKYNLACDVYLNDDGHFIKGNVAVIIEKTEKIVE